MYGYPDFGPLHCFEWKARRLRRDLRDRRDPAGAFGAEEARRPPRGKRSSLEWKATASSTRK
ncbi:hypothetical protein SD77_0018 [Bacillus badius]|uniref:Ribose 5-phosphate isomerase B n=1 Tax=Bacillus badius TaxID=1455 RepID=A0ABR5AZK1_BACBA|nr:hypothetical protein SD77_0018 [Bacillus badius]